MLTQLTRKSALWLRQLQPVRLFAVKHAPLQKADADPCDVFTNNGCNECCSTSTLVHAFISSRIDYCNSVFIGISGPLLQRLQAIHNAAARLITGTRRSQHVTLILRQLHWLPIRQRILFKTAVLVYKCRHGMAPSYLSTYCFPTSSHDGRCHLRSAESGQLSVPRMTTNYGDRSLAVRLCETVC